MGNGKDKQASWAVTEYVKLLGGWGSFLMFITVLECLIASYLYKNDANTIEIIIQRDLAQHWVIMLLWIPLTLQILVLIFLSVRVWKHKNDHTIRDYFKFYFLRTFISSWSYVSLWLCYIAFVESNASIVNTLRWLSLFCIALLIYFVVQATYLITRSSFRNDKRIFTERDIEGRYECICNKLEEASWAAKFKSTSTPKGKKEGAELIHEWLLKDRDYKVHRVAYKGTINDLDIPHFLEALNRLVISHSFYNRHNNNEGYELPPSLIETNNREYIEKHLLKDCEPHGNQQGDQLNDGEIIKKEILGLITSARERLGERLGGQRRTDKLLGQKGGIILFPFYTLVFFFSIFLCIAYLFGFAFAFEDKHVQLKNSKPSVALFMSDDLLEDPEKQATQSPATTTINFKQTKLQQVFYFDSGGAGIRVKRIENAAVYSEQPHVPDTEKPDSVTGSGGRYVAQTNQDSLKALVLEIKTALDANKPVRVELVGRADDNAVDKITYASNYEVAAARIKSVRYALQEQLMEMKLRPDKLTAIEWIEIPFSNDLSLAPKRRQKNSGDEKGESSNAFLVLSDSAGETNILSPKEREDLIDIIISRKQNAYDGAWRDEIRTLWEGLRQRAQKGNLTKTQGQHIIDDIDDWNKLKINQDHQEAEALRNKIEQELYQLKDPEGSQRAVEVFLFEAEPLSPKTTPQPHFKRMALMDYLYFAMYTITTTGYGDIKPMTPFAKFLCTIANMTEFFFIVVFFNTLLSLRRGKEEIS